MGVLLRILLWLLAAALAALALGAFASLNPAAPTWMRTLSALEGVLAKPTAGHGAGLPGGYPRGLTEALLSALAVFLAALPSAGRTVPTRR